MDILENAFNNIKNPSKIIDPVLLFTLLDYDINNQYDTKYKGRFIGICENSAVFINHKGNCTIDHLISYLERYDDFDLPNYNECKFIVERLDNLKYGNKPRKFWTSLIYYYFDLQTNSMVSYKNIIDSFNVNNYYRIKFELLLIKRVYFHEDVN